MNNERIAAAIKMTFEHYKSVGKIKAIPSNEVIAFAWVSTLERSGMTDEAIEAALGNHIATSEWPPTPASIIPSKDSLFDQYAALAWEDVRSAMGMYIIPVFEDRAVADALNAVGGWDELMRTPGEYLGLKRKEFTAALKRANGVLSNGIMRGTEGTSGAATEYVSASYVVPAARRITDDIREQFPDALKVRAASRDAVNRIRSAHGLESFGELDTAPEKVRIGGGQKQLEESC